MQRDAALTLLQSVELKGSEHLLDVGCGDGKITAQISRALPLGSILGIDISPEMIAFAQSKYFSADYPNLQFSIKDAQKIEYHEEFDIIFSSFSLQWIKNRDPFFLKAYKSLKNDGKIVATIPVGISTALEASLEKVLAFSKWQPYFIDFIKTWDFPNIDDLSQQLKKLRFDLIKISIVSQETIFTSREALEQYILPWFPYLKYLPQHLSQFFFKELIDQYFEMEPLLKHGKASFIFHRIDLICNK